MEKTRLEPWDELSDKNIDKVNKLTEAIHKATDSMEANLATDPIKIPGQNWACVSFVSPEGSQKCKSMGMKIRGVFDKHEEAVDYVKRLIRLDPTFDIFVCDLYNWCLIPPDPEHISDQTYQDETLNTLISEYRKNQIYAKEHFEERKRELMEQAADEARQAALKRMKEESEQELIDATMPLELDDSRIIDITEVTPDNTFPINSDSGFVTASELMDSMVKGGNFEEV
jgi:excinuclease UvrABC nuclease subunit